MTTFVEPDPSPSGPETPDDALVFPASMDQEAFYYMEKLAPKIAPFNIAVRFRLDGPLDPDLIDRSFQGIAARHEILRTHFEDGDDELSQVVAEDVGIPVAHLDLSHLPASEQEEALRRLGSAEAQKSFDLTQAPLLRALVVQLSTEVHILHVSVHHAIADGWSIGILTEELASEYSALLAGQPNPLPPLPIQYADYAIWQREFLGGPDLDPQIIYWKNRLHGLSDLDLPTDHIRPAVKQWNGHILSELLPEELTSRLQTLANQNGVTLFHLFLATFKILLLRTTGTTDIAIGSPVAGRNRPELEPLIGTFINTLILRTDLSGDPTFHDVLARVRETVVGALAHQDVPFETLVRELRPARDPSRNPLFQVNFTHQRDFVKPAKMGPLQLSALPSLSPGTIFDLHFFMVERDGGWRVSCEYCTDLFKESTGRNWLRRFRTLLENLPAQPGLPISQVPILSLDESRQLAAWQMRTTPYPTELTIGQVFCQIAEKFPQKTALRHGSQTLSYAALHAQACQVALDLQSRGVTPGSLVGLAIPPSAEMIVGVLGILLAGGAYVPIDTGYPEERIRKLLADTGLTVVVTDRITVASLPNGNHQLVKVEILAEPPPPVAIVFTEPHSSHDPAHLLYTSGSTGQPKGVLVPHQAVIRLVCETDYMDFGPDEVFLLAAPMFFDASTFELWGALLHGATLSLPLPGSFGLAGLARSVKENGVTTLWLTAGLFQVMVEEHLEDLVGLRNLLAGGDVLPLVQVRAALEALPDTRLVNGYGPTENTTFTTCHHITRQDLELSSIPIGRPIANTSVWILDAHGQQVPVDVPGELYTGGDGLAVGYWRDPELTASRFLPNPCPQANGEIVFRTGDLARWRPDGSIEFLGRRDRQVKIRGCRVEPDEIEAVLTAHPDVAQARVATSGQGADAKKLVAWASPLPGHHLHPRDLAEYLAGKLPPFLCPDLITVLDSLPLNANGKIDTNALPRPEASLDETRSTEPPVTKTEKMLAATCAQLLGLTTIGRQDNIFDLGGHSLMVLRLFSRIRRAYGISLPLASLLRGPTIQALGQLIDADVPAPTEEISESVLIPVQPHGTLAPFFCIHGGGGGVLFSRHLAPHLSQARPLLAIEAPALSTHQEIRPESIPEIAAAYIQLIRTRQPHGPYFLGGFSFGGLVAYEMAHQLQLVGEKVAFLALLDTMKPGEKGRPYTSKERLARAWHRVDPGGRAGKPVRFLKRINARLTDSEPTESAKQREIPPDPRGRQLYHHHVAAMEAYEPPPYPGPTTLVRASVNEVAIAFPSDYGWRSLAPNLEIIDIPCQHLELFDEEHVKVVAPQLDAAIQRASHSPL